jgi:hypothetical protein
MLLTQFVHTARVVTNREKNDLSLEIFHPFPHGGGQLKAKSPN